MLLGSWKDFHEIINEMDDVLDEGFARCQNRVRSWQTPMKAPNPLKEEARISNTASRNSKDCGNPVGNSAKSSAKLDSLW